jgi:hypothetical protein
VVQREALLGHGWRLARPQAALSPALQPAAEGAWVWHVTQCSGCVMGCCARGAGAHARAAQVLAAGSCIARHADAAAAAPAECSPVAAVHARRCSRRRTARPAGACKQRSCAAAGGCGCLREREGPVRVLRACASAAAADCDPSDRSKLHAPSAAQGCLARKQRPTHGMQQACSDHTRPTCGESLLCQPWSDQTETLPSPAPPRCLLNATTAAGKRCYVRLRAAAAALTKKDGLRAQRCCCQRAQRR